LKLERIRHLPVVSRGRLVGVVTCRDLCRSKASSVRSTLSPAQLSHAYRAIKIAEIMTKDPITVTPETPAVEAASLMRRHHIGCLPVLENEKLAGIITESDFLDEFIRNAMVEGGSADLAVRAARAAYLPSDT
jgi:acetoin utilization protein AcuB